MPRTTRRLSRSVVVDLALEIADNQGLPAVSLASVAAAAECKAPSLYNHLDGLDDLLDELALVTTADFASTLCDSVVAKVGEDAIRAYAHAWRTYVIEHGGRYQATLRPVPHRGDEHRAVVEGMTIPAGAILSTLGIPDDRLANAGRALRSGLHGFSQLELTSSIGPSPAESFDVVVDVLLAGLRSLAE
ncbi:MAG: TetR-like C-terminal domain-containing protein [Acidimicrobiales bacterium]|nr:TetR-like C-terminal domain-containing protein [Acidimicrobiales bacterium]